jgi:peptidoglycan-N-acetylglucosamine deacetylase
MGKPVITAECYDRKPGDVNRYDFLGALQHPLNSGVKNAAGAKVALAPNSKKLKATPQAEKPAVPN